MSGWAHDVACCWSIRESGACAYDDGAVEKNDFHGTNRPCPERSNKDDEVIAHGVRPHLSKPQKRNTAKSTLAHSLPIRRAQASILRSGVAL
jgi:hypothetical protein